MFSSNLRRYYGNLSTAEALHMEVGHGCVACGSPRHLKWQCRYRLFNCAYCGRKGHVVFVCYKLNGLCAKCHCRGHDQDQCSSLTNSEWLDLFLRFCHRGQYSSRCQGLTFHPFGFYWNPVGHRRSTTNSELTWTTREIRNPSV